MVAGKANGQLWLLAEGRVGSGATNRLCLSFCSLLMGPIVPDDLASSSGSRVPSLRNGDKDEHLNSTDCLPSVRHWAGDIEQEKHDCPAPRQVRFREVAVSIQTYPVCMQLGTWSPSTQCYCAFLPPQTEYLNLSKRIA